MPQGIAICLALNSVNSSHYGGWSGNLNACEADADDMLAIAKAQRFSATQLLTKAATRGKLVAAVKAAANKLKSGDIFMLSYSGHGGTLPDLNGDEDDQQDETWCLYDGQVSDDELNALYATFAAGVRILVLSDSCHSGTVVKMAYYSGTREAPAASNSDSNARYRFMPKEVALRTYREHKAFYDKLAKKAAAAPSAVKGSILLISGCQDNQLSLDGTFNGMFTGHLLSVWRNGAFQGDYATFHKAIVQRMPPNQTPNLFVDGASNVAFLSQQPFTI